MSGFFRSHKCKSSSSVLLQDDLVYSWLKFISIKITLLVSIKGFYSSLILNIKVVKIEELKIALLSF